MSPTDPNGEGRERTDMEKSYGISTTVSEPFDHAVTRVREELAKEGFGVLTEIDVKGTLKKKLGIDFRRYLILGACNPPLAHKALTAELEIGLLLPCNVVVYEHREGESVVSVIDPMMMVETARNKEGVREVAEAVREKLARVVDAVAAQG